MTIDLEIFASDISSALTVYNVLRVERSEVSNTGPWVEITAPMAQPATLLGANVSPFIIVGSTLSFLVDTEDLLLAKNVTFIGINPLGITQVVSRINTVVGFTVAYEEGGRLKLTSPTTGTGSKIEIVSSSAVSTLGFIAGQRDAGEEPYIPLVPLVDTYFLQDKDGDAGEYYRSRYYNTITFLTSPYSDPFLGQPGQKLTDGALCLCKIDLVDLSGNAVSGQKVSIFSLHKPLIVEGYGVAVGRKIATLTLDNNGHAEIELVRGLNVRVLFEGTSLIRDIIIPDSSTCDLMTEIASAPDIWNVLFPTLPTAPRRTI